jgi:hypothetical protein
MTEFISRKYGNEGYEVIIKTDSHEHYRAAEDFARRLIDHAKPVTDNNVGCNWIPVTERLPDDGIPSTTYLCFWKGTIRVCKYWRTRKCFEFNGRVMKVTHWMPLPEPPKEVE